MPRVASDDCETLTLSVWSQPSVLHSKVCSPPQTFCVAHTSKIWFKVNHTVNVNRTETSENYRHYLSWRLLGTFWPAWGKKIRYGMMSFRYKNMFVCFSYVLPKKTKCISRRIQHSVISDGLFCFWLPLWNKTHKDLLYVNDQSVYSLIVQFTWVFFLFANTVPHSNLRHLIGQWEKWCNRKKLKLLFKL